MHDEIQRLADEFRITKAEVGRRCLFWGIQNPDMVRDIEVSEPYQVREPGRPTD